MGIAKQMDFHEQFRTIFAVDVICEAESMFKTNNFARRAFTDFIESKAWIDQLEMYERFIGPKNPETIWKKFGYKDPSCPVGNCSISNSSYGSSNPSQGSPRNSTITEEPPPAGRGTLFDDADVRAVLCFLLLPVYLQSEDFQAFRRSDPNCHIRSNIFTLTYPASEGIQKTKSHRLRDLLLSMVSTCFAIELDLYLMDPETSWIEDFKYALLNLPVTLMVSSVDRVRQESRILFVNSDPAQSMSSKKVRGSTGSGNVYSWAKVVGRDLHDLCAEDISPGGARQVETAVFNAKGYKVSITDGKACKLRALKPIKDQVGAYVYAVAVETAYFGNPKQLQELGMIEQSEKQFQQVEDLLSLLPLLVKVQQQQVDETVRT